MTAGGRVDLLERRVRSEEAGRKAESIEDGRVVRIIRGQTKIGIGEVDHTTVQEGDVIIYLSKGRKDIKATSIS